MLFTGKTAQGAKGGNLGVNARAAKGNKERGKGKRGARKHAAAHFQNTS